MEEKEKKSSSKPVLTIVLILLLVIVIVILILLLLKGCNTVTPAATSTQVPATTPSGSGLVIDKNAGEYVAATPDVSGEDLPGIAIPGFTSLTVSAGETSVTKGVNLFNPETNDGWYYLTYEFRLIDDSEQGYEVLYASDLIAPGKHIQSITLSRPLEAGEYPMIVHVQPYRMNEALSPTNNADMQSTLIVK